MIESPMRSTLGWAVSAITAAPRPTTVTTAAASAASLARRRRGDRVGPSRRSTSALYPGPLATSPRLRRALLLGRPPGPAALLGRPAGPAALLGRPPVPGSRAQSW